MLRVEEEEEEEMSKALLLFRSYLAVCAGASKKKELVALRGED